MLSEYIDSLHFFTILFLWFIYLQYLSIYLVSFIFIFHLLSRIFPFQFPSFIFYLLFSTFYPLFAIFHFPPIIFNLASSISHPLYSVFHLPFVIRHFPSSTFIFHLQFSILYFPFPSSFFYLLSPSFFLFFYYLIWFFTFPHFARQLPWLIRVFPCLLALLYPHFRTIICRCGCFSFISFFFLFACALLISFWLRQIVFSCCRFPFSIFLLSIYMYIYFYLSSWCAFAIFCAHLFAFLA